MIGRTVTKPEFDTLFAKHGPLTWAHVLQLRHQRGESINLNQVRCYRNALKLNLPAL